MENQWKSPFLIGKSTKKVAMFNFFYVTNYHRVFNVRRTVCLKIVRLFSGNDEFWALRSAGFGRIILWVLRPPNSPVITEKRLFHRGTQILYIQPGWKWGKSPDLLVWGLQMFAVESDLKVFWSQQLPLSSTSCRPIFDISQWRQTFLEALFNTYQVTTPEYTNG
jgi:hypothetical protein